MSHDLISILGDHDSILLKNIFDSVHRVSNVRNDFSSLCDKKGFVANDGIKAA